VHAKMYRHLQVLRSGVRGTLHIRPWAQPAQNRDTVRRALWHNIQKANNAFPLLNAPRTGTRIVGTWPPSRRLQQGTVSTRQALSLRPNMQGYLSGHGRLCLCKTTSMQRKFGLPLSTGSVFRFQSSGCGIQCLRDQCGPSFDEWPKAYLAPEPPLLPKVDSFML